MKYPVTHKYDDPHGPVETVLKSALVVAAGQDVVSYQRQDTSLAARPHLFSRAGREAVIHGMIMAIDGATFECEYLQWLANSWFGSGYAVIDERLKELPAKEGSQ